MIYRQLVFQMICVDVILDLCIFSTYLNGTNFREVENFAFREDLFSRMSCLKTFRGYLFSRIGYTEIRESAVFRYFTSTYFRESDAKTFENCSEEWKNVIMNASCINID